MKKDEKGFIDWENTSIPQRGQYTRIIEEASEKKQRVQFVYDDCKGDSILDIIECGSFTYVKLVNKWPDKDQFPYTWKVYIDGKRCHMVDHTLEGVMLIGFANKYDGINTQAHRLIANMLNMDLEEEARKK